MYLTSLVRVLLFQPASEKLLYVVFGSWGMGCWCFLDSSWVPKEAEELAAEAVRRSIKKLFAGVSAARLSPLGRSIVGRSAVTSS